MSLIKLLLRLSILCLLLIFSIGTKAEITLPAIFGSHMVLQQQTDASLWGKASTNSEVRVVTSWNNKSYSAKADKNGNWKIKVATPGAGGPYSITISDGVMLTLKDILIGEVWICSGQSNMEMPVKGFYNQPIMGSNEAIATSSNPKIRLFEVQRRKTVIPQNDFEGEWQNCEPLTVAEFSATAYYFGRMIQEALDVPVGLICSSWGGTRIEAWMSESGIKNFDWVKLPAKDLEDPNQNTPTVLFNGMINPMVGYSMRGGIWYQGESNRREPLEYEKLMQGMIENWRDIWGNGEFPFYFCQIAPFGYYNGLNSAFVRDAQFKASVNTPNSGMACLMDVGDEKCIHPANKEVAGERLAYIALAKTYEKKGFAYSGPVLKEISIEGSTAKLTFDHAPNGLTTFGKELVNFTIAGDDKRFFPANASITRQGISVSSPNVEKPVAVRYAYTDFVIGELFNIEGLPASSFRTDDWEMK